MAALSSLVISYTRCKTWLHLLLFLPKLSHWNWNSSEWFFFHPPNHSTIKWHCSVFPKEWVNSWSEKQGRSSSTRWLHMSSLDMQILLVWHFSETPSSQCMDRSKALLTSFQLPAQIVKRCRKLAAKAIIQTNTKHLGNDGN